MSVPVPLLLTFLVLSACQGHMAALLQTSTFLKESITLLNKLLETKVGLVPVAQPSAADGRDRLFRRARREPC